jgi:hypothetical protein
LLNSGAGLRPREAWLGRLNCLFGSPQRGMRPRGERGRFLGNRGRMGRCAEVQMLGQSLYLALGWAARRRGGKR